MDVYTTSLTACVSQHKFDVVPDPMYKDFRFERLQLLQVSLQDKLVYSYLVAFKCFDLFLTTFKMLVMMIFTFCCEFAVQMYL